MDGRVAASPRRQAGSGWLELAVAAAVIAVLAAVLLPALIAYQALAEKTTVELTIMNMRTGMRFRIAELIVAGRTREVAGLVGANPVGWLAHPPAHYLGEIDTPENPDALPRGTWYFDRGRRELVYVVNHENRLLPSPGERKLIRLRVAAAGEEDVHGSLLGVVLRTNKRYDWP